MIANASGNPADIEYESSEQTEYYTDVEPVVPDYPDSLKEINDKIPPLPEIPAAILKNNTTPPKLPPHMVPERRKKPKQRTKKYPKIKLVYDRDGVPQAPKCIFYVPPLPTVIRARMTMVRMSVRKQTMRTQLRNAAKNLVDISSINA